MNLKKLTKIYRLMANENRLKILQVLGQGKFLNVGQIAEEINLSYKSTQKHLTMLFQAGLVISRRSRINVNYSLAEIEDEFTKSLVNILTKR